MTVLGSLARRGGPQNVVSVTPWGDWSGMGSPTAAGVHVTHSKALQLLTVYGCNGFICDGISTMPVDVYRRAADGSPVPLDTPSMIAQPTVDLGFIEWATQFLTSLLMTGNFYGFRRYSGGSLVEVIPLDPQRVEVKRERGRKVFYVDAVPFSSFEIMHIPAPMWPGSDVGMSPLEAARQTIGYSIAAEDFGAAFFGQGANMAGVIEAPADMTPEAAKNMARGWDKSHGGVDNAHKTGVLVGGAQWKMTGVTNEQSQFLETQKFSASKIAAQLFRIDPSEMGLPIDGSSLTYANQEQRNTRKVQVTFLPWIIRLEKALTSMIPRGQYVKLNPNGLLRGDTLTRYQAHAIGIQNEFETPNEARELEDRGPLPGGDTFQPAQTVTSPKATATPPNRTFAHEHH